jgi:hypothetical protein
MEDQNLPQPVLVGQGGPLDGFRWSLSEPILIGRAGSCEICISNQQVSREHARISLTDKSLILEDLGSKNGTYRNGKPVTEPVFLEDGDIIQIALTQEFIFLGQDATLPLAPGDLESSVGSYFKRVRLEKDTRRAWVLNCEIDPPISALQFKFLLLLAESGGRVVSRSEIMDGVWGLQESIGVTDQALDALVRRLRDRLSHFDASHRYIITVRGQGYRLDNPPYTG